MFEKKFMAKDGTEVLFREPKQGDAKRAMHYINAFVEEKRSGLNIKKKVTLKEETAWLKGVLNNTKKKTRVGLFVINKGKIQGQCSIERKRGKQDHRAYMGIGLNKEIRGKGIGPILLDETIGLAKKRMHDLEIIETSALEYNKRAQYIYKKVGFKKVSKMPKSAKEGREYIDEYFMHLCL